MSSPNPNFDTLLSTTLANYRNTLVDNVFSARPLAFFLKDSGNIRREDGGERIVEQLIHGKNTTFGSYSGYDPLDTTPQEGISAAEFRWKQASVSITISGIEQAMNAGQERLINLLEAKTMQAEESAIEGFDEMWFLDGTGNGGKDFDGLDVLVAQNTAPVGGIDPSVHSFWQSTVDSASEVLAISKMTHVYNSASVGNNRPTLGITTQALFEKYESLLQPALRYQDTRTADAGFQNLVFKGVPLCYDDYCQAGRMYFLNTKHIKLVGHSDVWAKPTPFVKPPSGDYIVAQILWYGNLVVNNRRRHGVLLNKSAS